jgi:DNA-binding response OmpR family regulator
MRILIVDDDAESLPVRRAILEAVGHHVDTASNPAGARSCFAARPPDIVILDLRLPRIEDGLALIREWGPSTPPLRIIVLSGRTADLENMRERTLVDRVLRKPVRSERLLDAIAGCR